MAGGKIQAGHVETELGLNTASAVESIGQLESAVKSATNEWKQMESQAKRTGDDVKASEVRYDGLTDSISKQRNLLEKLKLAQSSVSKETEDGAKQYDRYGADIAKAERKLTSLTAQQEKAKRAYELQEAGINSLNKEIRQNVQETEAQVARLKAEGKETEANEAQKKGLSKTIQQQTELYDKQTKELDRLVKSGEASSDSISKQKVALDKTGKALADNRKLYDDQNSSLNKLTKEIKDADDASRIHVDRLKAEGKNASATDAEYKHLKDSLKNLKSQYGLQEDELKKVENASGKTSDAYKAQRKQLDKTGEAVADAKHKLSEMTGAFNKVRPTGIKKLDNAVIKVKDHTHELAEKAKTSFSNMKSYAVSASVGIGIVGASLINGAKQASTLQNTYVENTNLLETAGEKAKDVTKAVAQMQKDGTKYSVEYGESQKNIASGYQELIKRGYTGAQSLGAMKSILQASKASGDDFSDTMEVTTSTLEAFGMRTDSTSGMMKNTRKVANELAMAADATATNFSDLGVGMSYVGTTADQAGLSLTDTASAMGVLSNAGINFCPHNRNVV